MIYFNNGITEYLYIQKVWGESELSEFEKTNVDLKTFIMGNCLISSTKLSELLTIISTGNLILKLEFEIRIDQKSHYVNEINDPIFAITILKDLVLNLKKTTNKVKIDNLFMEYKLKKILSPTLKINSSMAINELEEFMKNFEAMQLNEDISIDITHTPDTIYKYAYNKFISKLIQHNDFYGQPFTIDKDALSKIDALVPGERDLKIFMEETIRQRQVCHRFFRVGKNYKMGSDSSNLPKIICSKSPIILESYGWRSLIIWLAKEQMADKKPFEAYFKFGDTVLKYTPAESKARHRQIYNLWINLPEYLFEPYRNAVIHFFNWSNGDFSSFSKNLPYGRNLAQVLNYITGNNPLRVAKWIEIIKSRKGQIQSFNLQQFNSDARFRLAQEAPIESDHPNNPVVLWLIHILNMLLFLMLGGEVIRRLYRTPSGKPFDYKDKEAIESDLIPVALLQAKTLDLLSSNVISINDAFGESTIYKKFDEGYGIKSHNSRYNAVNGQSTITNINMVKQKSWDINSLAKHALYGDHAFSKAQMKATLKNYYGGENESDDEDYSLDEYEENYQIPLEKINKNY